MIQQCTQETMEVNSILGCINASAVSKRGKANFSAAFKSGIWHSLLDSQCKKDADKLQQVQGRVTMEHSPFKERGREMCFFSLEKSFWGQRGVSGFFKYLCGA